MANRLPAARLPRCLAQCDIRQSVARDLLYVEAEGLGVTRLLGHQDLQARARLEDRLAARLGRHLWREGPAGPALHPRRRAPQTSSGSLLQQTS